MVQLVPIVYDKKTEQGDFKQMITDPQYKDAVFIIQENVLDGLNWENSTAGAGTAAIRPYSWVYNQDEQPKALGIYTGWSVHAGGFRFENDRTIEAIDVCIDRLYLLLLKYPSIKRIIYSANPNDKDILGTGIFDTLESVLRYVSFKLIELENGNYRSPFPDKKPDEKQLQDAICQVNRRDKNLYEWALTHDERARRERERNGQTRLTGQTSLKRMARMQPDDLFSYFT